LHPRSTSRPPLVVRSPSSSPSSIALFNQWFTNATGIGPAYQANGIWAAMDMLESAIYRVTQSSSMMAGGVIKPIDIQAMLVGAQMAGVYGRVVFDAYRVNTPTPTIMVQLMPGQVNPFIVAPSNQAQVAMVYPGTLYFEV